MHGGVLLGVAFAIGAAELTSTAGTVAAVLLAVGGALEVLGGTANWIGRVGDQFAARWLGYRRSTVSSVRDVGGTGAALDVLQRYHPHLDATLFDLPHVTARALTPARDAPPPRRANVGGSFFDTVPAGHDRYLLLAVVHDWDDEHAVALLSNVRDAMPPGARAVVVENVASGHPRDDFAAATDLLMYVLATGRERDRRQYDTLFTTAGLTITKRHPLPTGATAFELGSIGG